MQIVFSIAALAAVVASIWIGINEHTGAMIVAFLSFVVLLFISNTDRIAEIKATGTGFEAKTRRVLDEAHSMTRELRLLAKIVGKNTLSLVKRQGRIGSYSDAEQESTREEVLAVLRRIGIPEDDLEDTLADWHRFTEFDYWWFINRIARKRLDKDKKDAFEGVRKQGWPQFPTPQELRSVYQAASIDDSELIGLLEDYEYYKKHRLHRRPESWRLYKESKDV